MAGLILWKNEEINRLKRDMDRLFSRLWDDFGISLFPRPGRETPSVDLTETENTLTLTMDIPGIHPDDLEISVTEDLLTLKGYVNEETVEETQGYHRRESRHGGFYHTIQLPCKVEMEEVDAIYKDGVLRVIMPKCKPRKARDVRIKVL